MNALIFDVETNGKAKNFKAPMYIVDNWPRVAQLAWLHLDLDTGLVITSHQSLIYPDGWTIPTVEELKAMGEKDPNFFVDNNMSTERCMEEGSPISNELSLLIDAMNDSDYLVAHNVTFDVNCVGAEMIRLGMSASRKLKRICTMEASTDFCNLPGKYKGKPKWPKLIEVYKILFNEEFDGAHDAMSDVTATARVLLELIKRGILTLEQKDK